MANVHRQLLFLKQGLVIIGDENIFFFKSLILNKLIQHPNIVVALHKLFNYKLDTCILNT
jgi:hypothetical protein